MKAEVCVFSRYPPTLGSQAGVAAALHPLALPRKEERAVLVEFVYSTPVLSLC